MRRPIDTLRARQAAFIALAVCALLAVAGCRTKAPDAEPAPKPTVKSSVVTVAFTAPAEPTALLEALAPAFSRAYPQYTLEAVPSTNGEAMALGEKKDADVLLIHRPAAVAFAADGRGTDPRTVMHYGYLLVGPTADPAKVRGTGSLDALRRIRDRGATFISRGDESATHAKEIFLWDSAGVDPVGPSWYVTTAQGMLETLKVASERQGYALVDRATWYSSGATFPGLAVLVADDPELREPYSVVRVTGANNAGGATAFADWITSPGGQAAIGAFRVEELGAQTFVPFAGQ